MRLSATRLTSIAQAGGGRTLIQRAIAILRRYGTDAHIYLPGVGMLNGLQAANYIDSAGTTAATVDQPVGLVLDAAGSVGVELVTNGDFSAGATGWAAEGGVAPFNVTVGGGVASFAGSTSFVNFKNTFAATVGKTYLGSFSVVSRSAGGCRLTVGGIAGTTRSAVGDYSEYVTATTTGIAIIQDTAGTFVGSIDNISVREVTGIAASQPTTSNKCILRQTRGRYNWVFDATDLLTATFPAGNESVTVIDALGTGQVTTTGVNVAGAYSMGPSVTLYGRMIVKGVLTASELALLQRFANRLAGL